jgi:hypothetical protein
VQWEKTFPLDLESLDSIPLELPAPDEEGAYKIHLVVRRPPGLTDKLVPWEHAAPLASRDVEFVVIDPAMRVARLADKWDTVDTIDHANPRWLQRIPEWTQVDRLPGMSAPRPFGNVKPAVGGDVPAGFVELPLARIGNEPAWQAYQLSIADVDRPHAVEIELPPNARQHLGVSVIEPDAAGRVQTFGRDGSVYGDDRFSLTPEENSSDKHRMVFWPRTANPVLLLTNRSPSRSARYGKIRILRRQTEPAIAEAEDAQASEKGPSRLVAAYIGLPQLADSLGAAGNFDEDNKFSVEGWASFLSAATRLAQELDAAGYNAAIISIAANGSSLAPIDALGASPRYDAGTLASAAPDPLRKDVLEALLRVFDREGLRLIPAVELATPLPRLEAVRAKTKADVAAIECVARDGRPWSQHFPAESAAAPHYNILHPTVQEAVAEIVDQLAERYGHHPALAGVALQLSGRGYGVLPGVAWGMDGATISRFAADAKLDLPDAASPEARRVAEVVLGPQLERWKAWRRDELTRFYASVAERARRRRDDLQLVLCTEDLFSGPEAAQRLRQAAVGRATLDDAAAEIGVDLRGLAAAPGVTLLRPRCLAPDESLHDRAADLQVNASAEFDAAVVNQPHAGELFYHASGRLRLASFDARSPFGAETTYLSLTSPSIPAGDAVKRPLAAALAARDFTLLAEGAELLPLAEADAMVRARRLFQELPGGDADVRTERRQPATLRIYRHDNATTLCLINESPWPVEVSLPLETATPVGWRQLGAADDAAIEEAPDAPTAGTWPTGAETWTVALPPYGIEARRFDARALRVGALAAKLGDAPAAVLAQRIDEIKQRMQSLDVERPYNELQNPDFELVAANDRPHGWQPRVGRAGSVDVDPAQASSGARSLHLSSQDNLGVAAQSHLFAIPATGQLVVRASARGQGLTPGAQLYAWVEYDDHGAPRRRSAAIADANKLGAEWTPCEFAINDLPLGDGGQMRIHFHLAGRGEAWIDDVRLFDLRFPSAQRVELGKWLYAANTALDERELVECQRLVEGYLPRYLLEHVPPAIKVAEKPDDPAPPPKPAKEQGKDTGRRASRFGFPLLRR